MDGWPRWDQTGCSPSAPVDSLPSACSRPAACRPRTPSPDAGGTYGCTAQGWTHTDKTQSYSYIQLHIHYIHQLHDQPLTR